MKRTVPVSYTVIADSVIAVAAKQRRVICKTENVIIARAAVRQNTFGVIAVIGVYPQGIIAVAAAHRDILTARADVVVAVAQAD